MVGVVFVVLLVWSPLVAVPDAMVELWFGVSDWDLLAL